ncbi:hypothetical protein ACN28S_00115 [Cystobacter fuscus]
MMKLVSGGVMSTVKVSGTLLRLCTASIAAIATTECWPSGRSWVGVTE